jgi:hypothetical protein
MKRRRVRYSNRKYVNRLLRTFKPKNLTSDEDEEIICVSVGGPPKEQGK